MSKGIFIKDNNQWKKVKNVWMKIDGVWKQKIVVKGNIDGNIKDFILYTIQKTMEYTFQESSSSTQSHTFEIPNLISIDEITVDTGTATHTIQDNKVTVQVSNGSSSRSEYDSTKYSKTARSYSCTSDKSSFESSMSYSQDGYSGRLYKSGQPYLISGQYTPSLTKKVTRHQTGIAIKYVKGVPDRAIPPTMYYSEDGYSGRLTYSRLGDTVIEKNEDCILNEVTGTFYFDAYYEGEVTKPPSDTRLYKQDYSGTIYCGGYNTYYKYNIKIKYTIKN
ncbi:hypothetical protein [Clostridium botulinum]|uniref:hypothetical protein n=1 Tax=Clostridium botulinum TaxID=1491 RepID=UPI0006A54A34|nr:hypothetical protein [Clostridium botulinum]KOC50000.1 hypothetical protein ADU88_04205 [Clostridium botulinum]